MEHVLSSFKAKASESEDQGRRRLFKHIFGILWVSLAYFASHIFFYRLYFAVELQLALKLCSMFISCDDRLSPDPSFCFIFSSVTKSDGAKIGAASSPTYVYPDQLKHVVRVIVGGNPKDHANPEGSSVRFILDFT